MLLILIMTPGKVLAEEYEYDDLNRLIKVTYDDGSYVEYVYDSNGNIISTKVHKAEDETQHSTEQNTECSTEENTAESTGQNIEHNTGGNTDQSTGQGTEQNTGENTEQNTGENTGQNTVNDMDSGQRETTGCDTGEGPEKDTEEKGDIDESNKAEGQPDEGDEWNHGEEASDDVGVNKIEKIADLVVKKVSTAVITILNTMIEAFKLIFK